MKDVSAEFERVLATSSQGKYVLRLYTIGNSPKSLRAVANIKKLCEEHLHGRYELTVVDLYQSPADASRAQVIAAPTLIKQLPAPLRRLIGDLSKTEQVLLALDIKPDDK